MTGPIPMTDSGGPSTPPEISATLQKLSPDSGAVVLLYEIDATEKGGDVYRFHDGLNRKLGQGVIWAGQMYSSRPILVTGFDQVSDSSPSRPRMLISNVDPVISTLLRSLEDWSGVKVIRRRTFERYLDAENFPAGNPNANPAIEFPPDIYWIDRKVMESKVQVEFELTCPIDFKGLKLPRRQVIANICPLIYKGPECGYIGPLPTCDKGLTTANGCREHFGVDAEYPYGGFPAATRTRA